MTDSNRLMRLLFVKIRGFVTRSLVSVVTNPTVIRAYECLFWLLRKRAETEKDDLLDRKRILIVRLDGIGDVVLSTPFLREMRRNYKSSYIALLVRPVVHNLVELCPYVDKVLVYNFPKSWGYWDRHMRAILFSLYTLYRMKFDLVIAPRREKNIFEESLVSYFCGANERVTYSDSASNEYPNSIKYEALFSKRVKTIRVQNDAKSTLDLIYYLGGTVRDDNLELWCDKKDRTYINAFLREKNVGRESILVGVGVGAYGGKRRWPLSRFVSVIKHLLVYPRVRIILFGNKEETLLGKRVQDTILSDRIVNLVGKTSLRQSSECLKHCHLYIGNDTGMMHIAAAMKTPIIEISCWPKTGDKLHVNSPHRFGPWKTRSIVLCPEKATQPCMTSCNRPEPHCILQVKDSDVITATENMLHSVMVTR